MTHAPLTPSGDRRVVAIDGPAGAGKSSVAKQVAEALGFTLLDTGALYRAVAVAAKQASIAWDDEAAVGALAQRLAARDGLRLTPDASALKGTRVWLDAQDVTKAIRVPDISMGASRVSAIAPV
ncbi:MAG TPA: cytidylate kinase, partial [Sorangium sp.]|nr:cytidylate kinase [Sorangium sp.]